MSYYADRGYDVDEIVNWSYHKKNFMTASMLINQEEHRDDIALISLKLDFPKHTDEEWESL